MNRALECNFDGGDCRTDERISEKYPDCGNIDLAIGGIGDSLCDDVLNSQKCGFDEGDCCLPPEDSSHAFCATCACIQTTDLGRFMRVFINGHLFPKHEPVAKIEMVIVIPIFIKN